jgi:hypothetical protein
LLATEIENRVEEDLQMEQELKPIVQPKPKPETSNPPTRTANSSPSNNDSPSSHNMTSISQNEAIKNNVLSYINGNELRIEKLTEYKKDKKLDNNLKASINLCLKLWKLDGMRNNSYSSLKKSVESDPNLKNSDLARFLSEISKQENPKYLKELPGNANIATLTQLKIKLK